MGYIQAVTVAPRKHGHLALQVDIAELGELHADARACAELAGLVYVEGDEDGWSRRRRGRGFTYLDQRGRPLNSKAVRGRLAALAIPPAWTNVWICGHQDGHLQATGEDDRGRKQYVYHPQWRAARDLINFDRLILVARSLRSVRSEIRTQLARRTLDRARVIAGMLALLDTCLIRIGSEVYAEENDSVGLTTLEAKHVRFTPRTATIEFRAKSGKAAKLEITAPPVVRLLRELSEQRGKRLFALDGVPIDADEVNSTLTELAGEHVTAKDFRTWGGTLQAFAYLRGHPDEPGEGTVLAAVDAAAVALGNTRAVARAHYVHPLVLDSFASGTFEADLAKAHPRRTGNLTPDERLLAAFLERGYERRFPPEHSVGPPDRVRR